ncbi:MAG: RNA polymerase sigma factor [Bryobacteraceae bacterium]
MPPVQEDLADILRECLEEGTASQWETFIRMAQPVVAAGVVHTLLRYGRQPGRMAEDLIQDVFLKLHRGNCQALRSFRGTGAASLYAYLRAIAANLVTDFLVAESGAARGGTRPHVSLDDPDLRAVAAGESGMHAIERKLLLEQIQRCLEGQKERDRRVFWLYHRLGFKPHEIAAFPGIALRQDGVETLLLRLTKQVAGCMRETRKLSSR